MRVDPNGTSISRAADALRGKMQEAAQAYRAKNWGAWRLAQRGEEDLRRHLVQAFAEAHGWRPAKTGFDFPTLARGGCRTNWEVRFQNLVDSEVILPRVTRETLDHPYYFKRDRQAAAIAAHLYNFPECKEECEFVAREFGVRFEVPEFPSWHYPGGTKLVLYIGPAGQ